MLQWGQAVPPSAKKSRCLARDGALLRNAAREPALLLDLDLSRRAAAPPNATRSRNLRGSGGGAGSGGSGSRFSSLRLVHMLP